MPHPPGPHWRPTPSPILTAACVSALVAGLASLFTGAPWLQAGAAIALLTSMILLLTLASPWFACPACGTSVHLVSCSAGPHRGNVIITHGPDPQGNDCQASGHRRACRYDHLPDYHLCDTDCPRIPHARPNLAAPMSGRIAELTVLDDEPTGPFGPLPPQTAAVRIVNDIIIDRRRQPTPPSNDGVTPPWRH